MSGDGATPVAQAIEAIRPGTRLGPYVVRSHIGAGGMGQIYRARDERLGRDVAIKVLPPTMRDDPTRVWRFEQEARTVGALNHPNVVAVFDFDARGATPYLVTELLEGRNLRERPGEATPWRVALDWGIQIARGLVAAHERGIVHRDIKPENLFLTDGGQVKILDFGIARASPSASPATELAVTEDPGPAPKVDPAVAAMRPAMLTAPGAVVGTAGYMSPEQVRGEAFDHRGDLFSFGAVLYELLTGRPCFDGDTPIEKAASILKGEPPPLSPHLGVPEPLERVLRRCLRKDPAERFQSTRDLVIDLEEIRDGATTADRGRALASERRLPRRLARLVPLVVVAVGAGAVLGSVAMLHRSNPAARYQRVTFRRGSIGGARFVQGGRQIVYSAGVDGERPRVFVTTPDNAEGRPITQPGFTLLSVSRTGEMALGVLPPPQNLEPRFDPGNVLARAPLDGGAPRQVLDAVKWADWSPDGADLAVVRAVEGHDQLEYPIGKPRFQSWGQIGWPRVSPDGSAVAFVHWPTVGDDRGSVEIAWRDGRQETLSRGWMTIRGLAFSPDGKEVWFAAAGRGGTRGLHAVTLDGRERLVAEGPGSVVLYDIAADGRVLVARDLRSRSIFAQAPGDPVARDISWLDMPWLVAISRDGGRVLFIEGGEGAHEDIVTYYRDLDGSPAVRLGEGIAWDLSPDGKAALMSPAAPYAELHVVPTGAGAPRVLPAGRIASYTGATFLGDGTRIAIAGSEKGRPSRVWLQSLSGGDPAPLTAEGYSTISPAPSSPDGTTLVGTDPDDRTVLIDTAGRPPRRLDALAEGRSIVEWLDAGRLLLRQGSTTPARLLQLDLATGRATAWRDISPPDTRGDVAVLKVLTTADRRGIVYQVNQNLGDLYLVTGLE